MLKVKKFFAVLLACVMLSSFSSVAFAENAISSDDSYFLAGGDKQSLDMIIYPKDTTGIRFKFMTQDETHSLTLDVKRADNNEVVYSTSVSVLKGFEQELYLYSGYFKNSLGYYIELSNPSLNSVSGVFSAESSEIFNKEMITKYALDTDDKDSVYLGEDMTRAKFCKLICKALGYSEIEDGDILDVIPFDDVDKKHPEYKYICMAKKLGLVVGDGSGKFMPDKNIAFCESTKIMICAMGYAPMADAHGGYPRGYMEIGLECGFLSGMDGQSEDVSKRGAAVHMLYQALDVPFMVQKDRMFMLLDGKDGAELKTFRTQAQDI